MTYYASQDLYLQSSCLHSRAASRESECYVCRPYCNLLLPSCASPVLSFPCYVFFSEGYSTQFLVSTRVEFVSLGYLPALCVLIPLFPPKLSQPRYVSHLMHPYASMPMAFSFPGDIHPIKRVPPRLFSRKVSQFPHVSHCKHSLLI